jgi:BirA family biotin operon repressor/biotin-[acetyl-CoA-carboxylase] ligase
MMSALALGRPRLHLRETSSTNDRARELAAAGAPHGTLVTTSAQSAGRGRQGRNWSAPSGGALLCSLVLRGAPRLLPLAAAVATAEATGRENAQIKWPNDILLEGRKVAGILVEGRPQEGWAVCGIGINVALRTRDLPPELHDRAGTLGLEPTDVERVLERLLAALEHRLADPPAALLDAWRTRDALAGNAVRWAEGEGVARGIDGEGRLVVERSDGGRLTLDAGEVHLLR